MNRIIQFVIIDIFRNKIILVYSLLLSAISWSTFLLEDNPDKGILTLLNIISIITPLVSILFSTIYIYNCNEFIELLLSHPIERKKIWIGLFFGIAIILLLSTVVSIGIPLLLFAEIYSALMMILMGGVVTIVFTSLSFLCSVLTRDKAKGIGAAIILWLYFAIMFDVLVLFILIRFSDYPIEKFAVVLTATNPIDLTRILVLLQSDVSAILGYTGAIFKTFFGTMTGLILSASLLLFWIFIPFLFSLYHFKNKDL